jgi:four helix bundle protein
LANGWIRLFTNYERKMRDFRKLEIWNEGILIAKEIYLISEKLPNDERFGLKSQIQRAVVSIPSNIAEGAGRSSEKEFKHYLEIALGSSFELETQLILIKDIILKDTKVTEELFSKLSVLQKKINAFISKINKELK